MYLVCEACEDGAGGSSSYRKSKEKRYRQTDDNVVEAEISLKKNDIGSGSVEELSDNELVDFALSEELEEYEQYNDGGFEFLSDADDDELIQARKTLKL